MSQIPIKSKESMFTDQQWEAIHTTGSNLLISASAGSGKTMVLVNRIIEQIKKGVAIDELLVVTFTNAAAAEMKQRIQEAIQNEINADPEHETRHHLVEQLPKLGHANISTLHSFCLEVIERYYYLIDFDPVFRLLTDDTEIALIKEDIWNDLLEELYEEADHSFIQFMEAYAGQRDDDGVTDMVFRLHEFSQANENPTQWLDSLADLYNIPSKKLEKSKIYKEYLKIQFIEEINYIIQLIEQAISLANDDEYLEKQINIFNQDKSQYKQIKELLEKDQLQKVYELVNQGYKFPRLNAPRKNTTPEEVVDLFHSEIKELRNEAKAAYQKFEGHFLLSPKEQVDVIEKTKQHVNVLSSITQQFANKYQSYKIEQKLTDFNDLEHLTLKILTADDNEEISEPSKYYRNKFHEVLVDEYQDINALQEAILVLLSKPETDVGNYFMVGDVKQSIYGFRLADPGLFLKKYEDYAVDEHGKRIILAENFRSCENILSFTNFIYTQLMDYEVGNLDYDKNAKLVYGNKSFKQSDHFDTEVLIYEKGKEEKSKFDELNQKDEDKLQINHKTTGEILMTASKIKELIENKFEIYDKKLELSRPLEYKDIVLLTPTKNNNLEIQEIFQEAGVPSAINETQNFFQTTEVTIMMSLLKIIDNPKQDIPLVAVLRSPIIGLNEIELTYIRLENREADFYDATLAYAEADFEDPKNIALQKQIRTFLDDLDQWREYARRHSVVELLRLLYQETGYVQYVGGMSGGKQRKANLEALYQRAATYEKTAFKGLYRFIRFIDKMQEKDKDLAEPISILDGQDAVRVMTIHASKGLEFPVVFLMDMSKGFNNSDWTGSYVFDQDLGIGLEYRDADRRIRTSTLVDTAIKDIKKQNGYAEQMRLLYVALTRAEQKLFLVGTSESKEKAFDKWDRGNGSNSRLLPAKLRLTTNNFMDWIGLALARHKITENEVNSLQTNEEIKNYRVNFMFDFYSEEKIVESFQETDSLETEDWLSDLKKKRLEISNQAGTNETVEQAMKVINYKYPHHLATQTTNYQSVSEVKQLFEEPDDGQLVKIDWTDDSRINRYTSDLFEKPKFLQETSVPSGAEVGQATHLLLQEIDLSEQPTKENIKRVIKQLINEQVIRKEIASKIIVDQIIKYFHTSFGKEIIKHFNQVEREVLFSLIIDANEIFVGMDKVDDSILIHGIIDGYFEGNDGLVLFDYKTDRVAHLGESAKEELIRRYRAQLLLYKQALETITNKEVIKMNIISLDLQETVTVE